ncbi:MAG: GNAT family N-acetyltransferase [Deltaproteobacteria bacterium]|nr:GNAT family N-acetyltransferase [Deltaproteobacteria bacterium]
MIVETATLNDVEEILALQKRAYLSEAEIYDDFTIPPLRQTLEEIKKDFEVQIFLKAVENGRIIGSVRAFLREGTCYVGRLIVHPEFQNQGIGKKLMGRVEEVFKAVPRFEIFTGHKSERNLHLYGKLGYRRFKTVTANEKLIIVFLEKYRIEETGDG